jgi:uncharacterized protein (TIGR00725 family)
MIAVCGPNDATPEEYELARRVGAEIARAGHALVCGGRGGVMEAAAAGTKSAGGVTIGILPTYDRSVANEYIDHVIPTGLGHARNALVVAAGDAVIAIGGGFGTLSEIGLALKMGKRVIHIGSWEIDEDRLKRLGDADVAYLEASSSEEAVHLALYGFPSPSTGHG